MMIVVHNSAMARVAVPELASKGYDIYEWRNALAILRGAYPTEWQDIVEVMDRFRLCTSYLQKPGGNESTGTKALKDPLAARGWGPRNWDTRIQVTDTGRSGQNPGQPILLNSPTHEVDHVKGQVALEIEWSNKDPFFDRDLNNFRLLFDLRVIGVGVIITKSNSLIDTLLKSLPALDKNGVPEMKNGKPIYCATKFGASTTWYDKLQPRVEGGGGGGCPILVISINEHQYDANC